MVCREPDGDAIRLRSSRVQCRAIARGEPGRSVHRRRTGDEWPERSDRLLGVPVAGDLQVRFRVVERVTARCRIRGRFDAPCRRTAFRRGHELRKCHRCRERGLSGPQCCCGLGEIDTAVDAQRRIVGAGQVGNRAVGITQERRGVSRRGEREATTFRIEVGQEGRDKRSLDACLAKAPVEFFQEFRGTGGSPGAIVQNRLDDGGDDRRGRAVARGIANGKAPRVVVTAQREEVVEISADAGESFIEHIEVDSGDLGAGIGQEGALDLCHSIDFGVDVPTCLGELVGQFKAVEQCREQHGPRWIVPDVRASTDRPHARASRTS